MKRVLVVGIGGIGGNLAAALSQHDPDRVAQVVGLSTNPEIARAINAHGYRLQEGGAVRSVPGRAVTALTPDERFDWILLATQPPQVEAAAAAAAPNLAPGGAMVVLQNGLCESRVARLVGPGRVVGGIVGWGASMHAPGVYERTSEGGFTLGVLPEARSADGAERGPDLASLAVLLEILGGVEITDNLAGARWSKLAINSAISTLGTVGGDRLGALMRLAWVRRLGLEIVTEAVAVAKAEGVRLVKISGTVDLDWLALTDDERRGGALSLGALSLAAKHTLMIGVGTRYRNLRSSMLSAIERGRVPAVDFLNGEISERGRRHGIPTPANDAATALVHAIARGEKRSGLETLRWLSDQVVGRG